MRKIKGVKNIPTGTPEGRLLFAALAILTTSPGLTFLRQELDGRTLTPDQMLAHLDHAADEMGLRSMQGKELGLNDQNYYNKYNSGPLQRAADDEPIFVLRAQDVSAPNVVMEWINLNLNTYPAEKLEEAWGFVRMAKKYANRKIAD